jgi:hypothetical protein
MAEDKGKMGSDDEVSKVKKETSKEKKTKRSEERKDYAKEMWNKIKKTNASKEERADLKDNLKTEKIAENKEDNPKKKRRRRRRKKKTEEVVAEVANKENEAKVEPVEAVKPAEAVKPVNPFAPADGFKKTSPAEAFSPAVDLPPQDYEDRYQMEANDEGGQDDDSDAAGIAVPEVKGGVVEPINPFAPKASVKDSSLDDRTLEKHSVVKEGMEKVVDQDPSAEDVKQASEIGDKNVNEDAVGETEVKDGQVVDAEVIESKPIVDEVVPGHVEIAAKDGGVKSAEIDEFKEDFWEILEQAGVTKKRLIIFVIALVLGVLFLIFFVFNGNDEKDDNIVNAVKGEDGEISVVVDLGTIPYEVVSSYIFGLEYGGEDFVPIVADPIDTWADGTGIDAALILGDLGDIDRIEFVEFTDLLRSMENIFNTDVYSLVNLSTDRTENLNLHLNQMLGLIEDGEAAILVIDDNLDALDQQFEVVATNRDTSEAEFFAFLDDLYGQNAFEKLGDFIDFSQEANEIRAMFEANKALREKFINTLTVLIPRYEDILANKEALVKGVRVFDVPGSDIEAIQPFN